MEDKVFEAELEQVAASFRRLDEAGLAWCVIVCDARGGYSVVGSPCTPNIIDDAVKTMSILDGARRSLAVLVGQERMLESPWRAELWRWWKKYMAAPKQPIWWR